MNNKILARKTMHRAEKLDMLAPEQYGSRKRHRANIQGLNKRLSFDILRQKRQAGAVCSNDAKSLLRPHSPSVASLSMQWLGVPKEPIICMLTTIQKLEHVMRTAYGISEETIGDIWIVPFSGVGQGNGAGPMIGAVIRTPVLNLMRERGYGCFFGTALSNQEVRFVGYSFVDDTDLIQTIQEGSSDWQSLSELMQNGLNTWEGGLKATGGAIVPEKSFWYLIDFVWKDRKHRSRGLMNDLHRFR